MTGTVLILAAVGGLLAILIWLTRRSDRSVIERMRSADRVDGSRDPHVYTPHSNY
jgi:hypothetical protein